MKYIIIPFLFMLALILAACSYLPSFFGDEKKDDAVIEVTPVKK